MKLLFELNLKNSGRSFDDLFTNCLNSVLQKMNYKGAFSVARYPHANIDALVVRFEDDQYTEIDDPNKYLDTLIEEK